MIRAIAALMIGGLAAAACQPSTNVSSSPDIIIASDLPLSVPDPASPIEQAIGYAIRQQPTVEGFKLGYWSLDDSLGPDFNQVRGRENVRRLIADRRVLGMIGPYTSPLAVVQLPEGNVAGLAMLSPSTTNFCLTRTDPMCKGTNASLLRPTGLINYFRISPPDPIAGKVMAHYAAARLNLRRVAIFNEFSDGSLYVREFHNELANFGGQVVLEQDLARGTQDFSPFLKEAAARHADAVAGMASGDYNGCLIAAQMNTLLPDAILLGIDGIALSDACIKDAGPTPPKFFAAYPDVDPRTSSDPSVKPKVDAYVKAHPKPSDYTVYTFAAYDCARIMIDAIRRAIRNNGGQVPSRAQVVTALAATHDFVGLTGKFSFDANGDAVTPLMSMYQLRDGGWVSVPL
ncbi:MAG TPA: branched-chain amino acid ABC transporter substrate-binding protein [Candidatus Limnocylindrales bacterium]|nr:branched-chain amino acid ABC transporter substrate-binding protein [Candidatus Limnocylindrales bacterium]